MAYCNFVTPCIAVVFSSKPPKANHENQSAIVDEYHSIGSNDNKTGEYTPSTHLLTCIQQHGWASVCIDKCHKLQQCVSTVSSLL